MRKSVIEVSRWKERDEFMLSSIFPLTFFRLLTTKTQRIYVECTKLNLWKISFFCMLNFSNRYIFLKCTREMGVRVGGVWRFMIIHSDVILVHSSTVSRVRLLNRLASHILSASSDVQNGLGWEKNGENLWYEKILESDTMQSQFSLSRAAQQQQQRIPQIWNQVSFQVFPSSKWAGRESLLN